MSFDIGNVLNEMLDAAAKEFSKEWPAVKACVEKAFKEERETLASIAEARLKNEIDDDDLKSQLEDEKETLKAVLLVCEVKQKVAAQKAANAAIDVLSNAVKVALL